MLKVCLEAYPTSRPIQRCASCGSVNGVLDYWHVIYLFQEGVLPLRSVECNGGYSILHTVQHPSEGRAIARWRWWRCPIRMTSQSPQDPYILPVRFTLDWGGGGGRGRHSMSLCTVETQYKEIWHNNIRVPDITNCFLQSQVNITKIVLFISRLLTSQNIW